MGKKVAIFLHGQQGDILEASSVLRYKDELWGDDCEITWFIQDENRDLFKHNPYLKLQQFPHGYGISEADMNTIYAERIAKDKADGKPAWFDLSLVKTHDNKLDMDKRYLWEPIIGTFDIGYFPAPHQMNSEQRHGLEYSLCSKKVFGVPDDWEWHPVLFWSDDEISNTKKLIERLLVNPNLQIVIIETYCGSGQSIISDDTVKSIIKTCRDKLKFPVFIFVSHKYLNNQYEFPNWLKEDSMVLLVGEHVTVRQASVFNNYASLFICISSGISVSTSAWELEPTPKIQYCGSKICSTASIANGEFHLVESDFKTKEVADNEFIEKLKEVLQKI